MIFQIYTEKDKKGNYCIFFAVYEEEKGILCISILPY